MALCIIIFIPQQILEVVENPIITTEDSAPTQSAPNDKDNTPTIVGATLAVMTVIVLVAVALLTLTVYIRRVKRQKMKLRHDLMQAKAIAIYTHIFYHVNFDFFRESMTTDRRSSVNNYGMNDRFFQPRGIC